MDFGRLRPDANISELDFSLPDEPEWNSTVLDGEETTAEIKIGAAKLNGQDLIINLYPPKTREKDGLKEYSRHFNVVEFNTTHYKLYPPETFERWAGVIENPNFKFCPKFFQGISHRGTLNGKTFITDQFIEGVRALGNYLGPCFLQPSDSYSARRKEELFEYLSRLPKDMELFLELRHPSWFEPEVFSEVLTFLQFHNMGLNITDTPGRRDILHMHLTIPKCFVRFVSCTNATDYDRLTGWCERFRLWRKAGLKEGYFFVHADDHLLHLLRLMQEKIDKIDT